MGKYYQNQTEIEQRGFVIVAVTHITYNVPIIIIYFIRFNVMLSNYLSVSPTNVFTHNITVFTYK